LWLIRNWWNKLTNGQRKIIGDAAGVAEEHVRNYIAKIEADAYKVAKENGMKVLTPSAADIQAFKAASSSVYEQYKAKAGPLGAQLLERSIKAVKP
jgi:C4-dicarboxylate-binding protein DctP